MKKEIKKDDIVILTGRVIHKTVFWATVRLKESGAIMDFNLRDVELKEKNKNA